MKDQLQENAYITTTLTEQGKKDLDLFNPSYRVKLVHKLPIKNLQLQIDLYLDILQCEKTGLLKVEIAMDEQKEMQFKEYLRSLYMSDPQNREDKWNVLRTETIKSLVKILTQEIIKEIREELKEESENFVITKCKESYRSLLMTGPFTTKTA
jgi:transcriptional accessory protein Tex/SPT6